MHPAVVHLMRTLTTLEGGENEVDQVRESEGLLKIDNTPTPRYDCDHTSLHFINRSSCSDLPHIQAKAIHAQTFCLEFREELGIYRKNKCKHVCPRILVHMYEMHRSYDLELKSESYGLGLKSWGTTSEGG